ncbi:glycoside hydrolase family 47 protein [Mycena filopes]|nr:glycoside hydrolase family 47 protein [Mycena filopes]
MSHSHARPSFLLLSRAVLRRWWPALLLFVAFCWFSTTALTPRRFRFRVFKSSRPLNGPRPPPILLPVEGDLWGSRAQAVRAAFVHAYTGYQTHALPHDELKPMSGEALDNFHGWGVTMFDSLDTMWLMGLEDMFYDTVEDVAGQDFGMPQGEFAHFFEVVIRYLGGLLSAYALSEDPRLLRLADNLGGRLLPAFDTPSGFPLWGVNTETGELKHGGPGGRQVCLAEAFSNQMEFKYLAHLTGNGRYYSAAEKPMKAMYGTDNIAYDGLLPTMWDVNTGEGNETAFSAGGYADSAYEYFLKQWLLTGQKDVKMRDLYVRSANAIIEHLLYVGPRRQMLYVTDLKHGVPTHRFEHLSCFLPGMLALGAHTPALALSDKEKQRHRWAAEGLANTCWAVYDDVAAGLSPDYFMVDSWTVVERGRWVALLDEWEATKWERPAVPPGVRPLAREREAAARGYSPLKDAYLLRPEAVETFYIMWRTTKDVKWRERGWAVFEALQKSSRVRYGYTSVRYLDEPAHPPFQFDDMPSWFLAETLKYLFLLFTDEELLPEDKWVFNTEAHPLPVFQWTSNNLEDFASGVQR